MNRVLYLCIGILIGTLISTPIVFAMTYKMMLIGSRSGAIVEIGTTSNPIYVQGI